MKSISGLNVEKLLAIPKLSISTDKFIGKLCHIDTTNSSVYTGAILKFSSHMGTIYCYGLQASNH